MSLSFSLLGCRMFGCCCYGGQRSVCEIPKVGKETHVVVNSPHLIGSIHIFVFLPLFTRIGLVGYAQWFLLSTIDVLGLVGTQRL